MYYRAYNPLLMGSGNSEVEQISFLQKICFYAYQSLQIFPISSSAFLLADVFRINKFYGTAIHWYKQAETLAKEVDNTETATKAKAKRLDLQSDGKTSDPSITRKTKFPLSNTPGLILASSSSPAQNGSTTSETTAVPETATKNGCMGVFAVVACVVGLAILFMIIRGTTASQSINARLVQPISSIATNASTVSPTTAAGDNSRAFQSWPGEHFPQTRVSYLQEADIQGWSYSGVRYALNEMYARHGYLFKEGPLRHQFQKFAWYHPALTATSADVEAQFTPTERANQRLLAEQRNRLVQEGKAIK